MVGVNKPIRKTGDSAQNAPKRRPRNTELNSSKKPLTGLAAAVQKRCQSLNSSKSYDGYSYEEVSLEQLANESGVSVPELTETIRALESEKGCKVTKILVSTEREKADLGDEWDGKSIIVQTDCGDFYWGTDEFVPVNSSKDQSVNCEAKSAKVSGTVTIYNDFSDLDNDTTERLLRSRIEKAVPSAKVDFEKVNDTDVKIKIDCPDADAEKARLAVESSDVTKSVDWSADTAELDSANSCSASLDSAEDETEDETETETETEDETETESATITTESGNEVSLSDIKIVQNPDTNELALFIKETEEDEIPEGFVVIADATQADLSSDSSCPKCGKDPCECDDLDSSKKKNRR